MVYKGSRNYARIAEPLSILKLQKLSFQLEKSQNSEVFGITRKGGIVYIKNANLLKQINEPQVT